MNKATLGVLGLGSQTTAFYLKELNRVFNEQKGGYSTCPLLLFNLNFDAINSLLPHVSEELSGIVQTSIADVENNHVEHLLIPNITLHETIDQLKINTSILHPIDLCISKIKKEGWKQVVLFGSMHSMNSDYIRSHFKENDIKTVLPTEEDMLFLDQLRKNVYNAEQTEKQLNEYYLLVKKYAAQNPVVVACTELSIVKPNHKKLVDMAQLQIEAAVKTVV